MRFNFTRLSLLKFFVFNKKRTRRTLLVINFSIFLTIFAGTSAIISLYVENQISFKEETLLEDQRYMNEAHKYKVIFPMIYKSMETAQMFNRAVNRFNLFIDSTKFGDKIFSDRELYYYRYHALLNTAYDVFEVEDKDIEDIRAGLVIYEEGEIDIDHYNEILDKYYTYKKEFEKIKKNSNEFERYEPVSKYDLLRESESLETSEAKNYKDLYDFAWELHIWAIDLIKMMETFVIDAEIFGKEEMKDLNEDISNLSKNESLLILSAFLLQLLIFVIIQFFEISSVTREAKRG